MKRYSINELLSALKEIANECDKVTSGNVSHEMPKIKMGILNWCRIAEEQQFGWWKNYISYEVAKLLKEKGFDWATHNYYDEIGRIWFEDSLCDWNHRTTPEVSCPTKQVALDWLKEAKGMYVSVVPDFNEYGEYPDDLYWFARVYDLRNGDYIHSTKLCIGSQEAFEAALEYVLTNQI